MNRWLTESPERVLLVGDLHRSWDAPDVVHHAAQLGAQVMLQLGDLGWELIRPGSTITPSREIETVLPQAAADTGIPFLWVDGNHDRHDLLNTLRADSGLADSDPLEVAPGVVHLPRGFRLPWGEHGWLCLGGAVSLDRHRRQLGVEWFIKETITDEEIDRIIADTMAPVSVVVAHDAPAPGDEWSRTWLVRSFGRHVGHDSPWAQGEDVTWWPRELAEESDLHQQRLRRLADACLLPGGLWAHGHHHLRYSDRLGRWRMEGLGCAGQPMDELTLLVDVNGRPIR